MWDFFGSIGRGLGKIGSGITSGVKKIPGLGPDSPGGGAPAPLPRPNATFTTPSFNPAAKGGIEALNTDGISARLSRPDGLVDLPTRPNVPLNEMRWSARDARPHGSVLEGPVAPALPPASAMHSILPPPGTSAEGVPIPQLPGYKGDPIPYNATAKARYDYVMEGAKRDEGGRLLGKAEGGGFKRSGKDILMNSLIGGLQGAGEGRGLGGFVGGAAVGGIGSAVSPQKGREYRFKNEQEPQMMEQQGRQDADIQRQRQQRMGGIEEAQANANLEGTRARTDATRAGMKDAELEHEYRRAQIAKAQAEAEAKRTGQPKITDYVNEEGRVITGWVYPDGRTSPLGGSAKAAIATENNQTRKEIATEGNKTRKEIAGQNNQTRLTLKGMGGGRGGGRSSSGLGSGSGGGMTGGGGLSRAERNAMYRDMQAFERLKAQASQAGENQDYAKYTALKTQLDATARNIATKYGGNVEVGGGEWPYVKPRNASPLPQASTAPQGGKGGQPTPAAKPTKTGKTVTMEEIRAYAEDSGISEAESRQIAERSGFTVR